MLHLIQHSSLTIQIILVQQQRNHTLWQHVHCTSITYTSGNSFKMESKANNKTLYAKCHISNNNNNNNNSNSNKNVNNKLMGSAKIMHRLRKLKSSSWPMIVRQNDCTYTLHFRPLTCNSGRIIRCLHNYSCVNFYCKLHCLVVMCVGVLLALNVVNTPRKRRVVLKIEDMIKMKKLNWYAYFCLLRYTCLPVSHDHSSPSYLILSTHFNIEKNKLAYL